MQLFLAGTESNGLTFRQWFCLDLVRLVLLFPEQGQIIIFQATAHLNFKTVAWKYTKKVLAFCAKSVWGTNCLYYSRASRKRLYLFVHLSVFLYYLLVIYNVIMLYCTYFSLSLSFTDTYNLIKLQYYRRMLVPVRTSVDLRRRKRVTVSTESWCG